MNDTRANQWVPVGERLPEDIQKPYLVLTDEGKTPGIAYLRNNVWFPWFWRDSCNRIPNVTHWMDLPEPPEPPKPVDPFEAWWDQNCNTFCCSQNDLRRAWNAAKEHYAKPLPDFETWARAHCADGPYLEVEKGGRLINERAARIVWNAAQGKPEA